jgi:hypothetical protein
VAFDCCNGRFGAVGARSRWRELLILRGAKGSGTHRLHLSVQMQIGGLWIETFGQKDGVCESLRIERGLFLESSLDLRRKAEP